MKELLRALRMDADIKSGGIRGVDWQNSTSPKGYNLAEVLSAVIKEIRRGKEEEAFFWALEMAISGKEAEKFLWECLAVCSIEDIGLANPSALLQVQATEKLYFTLPERKEDGRRFLVLAHIVAYLARSPKTRYSNELCGAVIQKAVKSEMLPEIPDYALDFHVKRGRDMGRGLSHYLAEAATLENEDKSFPTNFRDYLLRMTQE